MLLLCVLQYLVDTTVMCSILWCMYCSILWYPAAFRHILWQYVFKQGTLWTVM